MGKNKSRKDRGRKGSTSSGWLGEADLHALAQSLGAATLIADPTGAVLFASKAFQAVAAAAGASSSNTGWLEVLIPKDRPLARKLLASAAEAGEPRHAELTLVHGMERRLWRVSPVTAGGQVSRCVISLADSPTQLENDEPESAGLEARLREEATRRAAIEVALSAAEARTRDAVAEATGLKARLAETTARLRHAQVQCAAVSRKLALTQARIAEAEGGPSTLYSPTPPVLEVGTAVDQSLDQLSARLRSRELRAQLADWSAAGEYGALPCLNPAWEMLLRGSSMQAELADVGPDGELRTLRRIQVRHGTPLERALGVHSPDVPSAGLLAAGWRRCARTGRPVHESVQLTLAGEHHAFERLLLPFSSKDAHVNLLLGLSVAEA